MFDAHPQFARSIQMLNEKKRIVSSHLDRLWPVHNHSPIPPEKFSYGRPHPEQKIPIRSGSQQILCAQLSKIFAAGAGTSTTRTFTTENSGARLAAQESL
jgi:hypothetical protein